MSKEKCQLLLSLRSNWDDLRGEIVQNPLTCLVFMIILICAFWGSSVGNAALFVAASAAGFFAYRRAKFVEQGMKNTEESRIDERFSRSCAMLGNGKGESVQIGGLISLDNLARKHPGEYKEKVFSVICAFVRTSNENKKSSQEAINIFLKKGTDDSGYFYAGLKAILSGADLKSMNLEDVCLSGADLTGANLTESVFSENSDFNHSNMKKIKMGSVTQIRGNFTNCIFEEAYLQGGKFEGAVLDGANFNKAWLHADTLDNAQSMKDAKIPALVVHDKLEAEHNIQKGENPS